MKQLTVDSIEKATGNGSSDNPSNASAVLQVMNIDANVPHHIVTEMEIKNKEVVAQVKYVLEGVISNATEGAKNWIYLMGHLALVGRTRAMKHQPQKKTRKSVRRMMRKYHK